MLEPIWWVELLQKLNEFVSQSENIFNVTAWIADYPIFFIPLFLLILYFGYGVAKKNKDAKYGALLIVGAAITATILNIVIQYFMDKARPETALMSAGRLVMKHLPTQSFPSDHAAVSMAIALATLWRSYRISQKKTVIIRWRILLIWSLLMSVARVAVGVHWPTDIIAGWIVWLVATCIIFMPPVKRLLEKYVIGYVVQFQEWLFGRFSR